MRQHDIEALIRHRLRDRLKAKQAELLIDDAMIEQAANGYEYLGGPNAAFKVTAAFGDPLLARVNAEAEAATGGVVEPLLFEARAARFNKAAGQCECPGVGCEATTHKIVVEKGPGVAFAIMRCSAPVAASMGTSALSTRVIMMHDYDDPTDSANLRVYCAPCADCFERAMKMG